MKTQEIDAVLRSLDAASAPLTEGEMLRAQATLEAVVATPSTADVKPERAPAVPRRRRRLALVAAAAALVVVSALLQSDGSGMAYASWTPTPSEATAADIAAAEAVCRNKMRDDDTIDGDQAERALAERRGDLVAIVYRTEDPDLTAVCLVHNASGTTEVDGVRFGIGGSEGPALQAPRHGFTQGAVFQYDGGAASITDGAVGPGVTAVTIHAGGISVRATVEGGRYVAWWPGAAFKDGPKARSGPGGTHLDLSYDLTLADGTVLSDVAPTRPS